MAGFDSCLYWGSRVDSKWTDAWRPQRMGWCGDSKKKRKEWREKRIRSQEENVLTQLDAGYAQGPDIHLAIILPLIHCQDHFWSHPGRMVRRERLITRPDPANSCSQHPGSSLHSPPLPLTSMGCPRRSWQVP